VQACFRVRASSSIEISMIESKELAFEVKHRPEVGRYLVASRDIQPLEVILEDDPAVFGPNNNTGPVCLACLRG